LQAFLDAIAQTRLNANCKVVVSNRPDVHALARAERALVPTQVIDHKRFKSREEFDAELVHTLRAHGVEWVALAGFMRVLTPTFLDAFADRVVNIHPSLLPAFPGVDAQAQAWEYGVRVTGCTVHFVDIGVDSGPIILQKTVPVGALDTKEDLRQRILEQEHVAFVEALELIAQGRIARQPGSRRIAVTEPGKG